MSVEELIKELKALPQDLRAIFYFDGDIVGTVDSGTHSVYR